MLKPAALLYDRFMRSVEEAGLLAWRTALLAPLSGSVLEIGAGTGRNLGRYPPAVTWLVMTEPDRNMRAILERQVRAGSREGEVVDAPAEHLPFPDGTFDAVVSTLVLCSVVDPDAALREIHRVLRPGGRLVFLEHVAAAERPARLRWQRRIEPIWKRVAGNCHLTRDSERAIGSAGFDITAIGRASMRKAPGVIRPTIRGSAVAVDRGR